VGFDTLHYFTHGGKKMGWFDFLGFVAGFLTTFSASPQLYYSYSTKDVKSIQMKFMVMLMSGLFLWGVYGILLNSLPLIIFNFVGFFLWLPILWLKLRDSG
jgi:MtN3 and saliva related transmembrane protein